ncbi:major facilitator superfamily domain-containing protein, partial [Mycena rosella]
KKRTPLPKLQLLILLSIQFAEPVTGLVIYPFVVQFVRDTGITGGDEGKTGLYSGLLESAFFLAESLTVLQFGRMSDMYGRRPVLLLGPLGLALCMLGFGLSSNFWVLFGFRCAQGAFNGNIGTAFPSSASDISDASNIADILSFNTVMWSVGATLSPFLGGVLANSEAKSSDTLGQIGLLRVHPYFLPCAVAASIAFASFVFAFLGLRETLPSAVARQRKKQKLATETDPLLTVETTVPEPLDVPDTAPPLRELLSRPVCIALLNSGLLAFCEMANESLQPLVYATPIGMGGLGLQPFDIGLIMGIYGMSNAFIQLFFGGRILRRFGPLRIFNAAFCALVLAFLAYPLLIFLAKPKLHARPLLRLRQVAYLSPGAIVDQNPTASTLIFIVDAAPNPASMGSVNGLAQLVGTALRGIAPSFSSSFFSLSVKNNLLDGYMVYFLLAGLTLGALRCSLLLP